MIGPAWRLRGLLAALLMFCSEAVLWTAPDARPAFEWGLIALAYLALAALLLDLAARWRLRDLFGLLALAGVYGLLNAALLNPGTAFADFPRTLFTRAMGGQALMGVIALAWWLRLTSGRGGRVGLALAGCIGVMGVIIGFWARYAPGSFLDRPEPALFTVGLVYTALAAIIGAAAWLTRRAHAGEPLTVESFRLGRGGWLLVIIGLVPLSVGQVAAARVDAVALVTAGIFIVFCAAVVWFQKRDRGPTVLDRRALNIAPARLTLPLIVGAVGLIIGWWLPRADGTDPLEVIAVLLTAYGLVWLPLVALVLGTREFSRLSRSMRL